MTENGARSKESNSLVSVAIPRFGERKKVVKTGNRANWRLRPEHEPPLALAWYATELPLGIWEKIGWVRGSFFHIFFV